MKKIILALIVSFLTMGLSAQHAPVAVDDTALIPLNDTVVINVVKNDYHPDGLSFKISSTAVTTFTDSTLSIFLSYDEYWDWTRGDTLEIGYLLIDENGNVGQESLGTLYVVVDNNPFAYLDSNNVKAMVASSNIQFWNPYVESGLGVGYFFPKQLHKSPVFSSNLWIGGLDENDSLHLAAERYRQAGLDFWAGPVSVNEGEVATDVSNAVAWNRVWKLTKDEIVYHKFHYTDLGYQPIEAIKTWPAHGDVTAGQSQYIAPFVDVDGDGVYDPMAGDYPLIRGDQCVFFVLNDVRPHNETKGGALGIEVHVMAYEFYNPDTLAMHNTVFYSYKVFNRSTHTYHNTIMGLNTDFDIGYSLDDNIGCDVSRGLYYGVNSSPVDGNGEPEAYGDTVPAQTVILLSSGLMNADGEDNLAGECNESINGTGFGDGIADNECFGMNRFVYYSSGGAAISDPSVAADYYQYMNGLWKDGTAIEYGGTGHISGGAYGPAARFVFPGMSDPCYWGTGGEEPYGPVDWTMKLAGLGAVDVRGTGFSGEFTFESGDMQRFDIAYVSAFAEEGKTALETVLDYSDYVKAQYRKNPDEFGYQYLGVADKAQESRLVNLKVWPNPAHDRISFVYDGSENPAVYTVRSVTGKTVASAQIQSGETVLVDMSNFPKGLYIVNVNTQKGNYWAKVVKQ